MVALRHEAVAELAQLVGSVVLPGMIDMHAHLDRETSTLDIAFGVTTARDVGNDPDQLDAWKRDYRRFFDMAFPRLHAGGLFLAHNVVNKKSEMEPFLRTVQTHPGLFTTIVSPSGEGMSISYKIR